MSVTVNGNTYLASADGKIYGQYPLGDAPVGGSFTDGQPFVISGSGFGTKSTAIPLVYDNFESGTNGLGITGEAPTERAIGGAWTWGSFTSDTLLPEYSNAVTRTNSNLSAFMRYQGNNYTNALQIDYDRPNTGDGAYFSFWQYYDKTTVGWTRNWKPWIVYGSNGNGIFPSSYVGFGEPPSDDTIRNAVQDTGVNEVTLWGTTELESIEDEWVRHEFYLVQSGAGVADGEWHHTVHRTGVPSITVAQNETAYETRGTSDYWRQWQFGAYSATDTNGSEASVYMDQIYFDNTQQRVELGNAATWAACTHREIQIPQAWSDSSITITANAGTFANSSTAYLYVVGADGTPVSTNGQAVEVNL